MLPAVSDLMPQHPTNAETCTVAMLYNDKAVCHKLANTNSDNTE